MKKLSDNSSGQALLLVLLSMSVVLVVVLSILARSTVDIGVSTRSEESVRAFSAAEAGIEQRLVAGTYGPYSGSVGGSTFSGDVTSFSSRVTKFVLPWSYWSGESATVWFVSHDSNGNLSCTGSDNPCFKGKTIQVCWGKEGTSAGLPTTPAIELSVFYKQNPGSTDFSTVQVMRATSDPNLSGRTVPNSFSSTDSGSCTIGTQVFPFQKKFDLCPPISPTSICVTSSGMGLLFARIRFLYNTDSMQPIGIKVDYPGNSSLPSQGTQIVSTGTSGSSNRKVEVIRGYKELPLNLTGGVFAEDGIQ